MRVAFAEKIIKSIIKKSKQVSGNSLPSAGHYIREVNSDIKVKRLASTNSVDRDAKSPVSGRRFLYLDVHYGLPYGSTYLPFSPFTYDTSGGNRHTHAGEAAVLLLDRQAHHCLLIYAVLAQTRDVQDVARL